MTAGPNIVLIVMDTARWDIVSDDQETAPQINRIANQGSSFSTCFSSAPWTLPAHGSLFTGCTPSRTGAHADNKQLGTDLQTLPECLSNNGYDTVGVSNNTWISEEFGFARGFQQFRKTWQYVQSDVDLGRIAQTEEGVEKLKALGRELLSGNPVINATNAIYGRFFRRKYDDGAKQTNEWIDDWLDNRNHSQPFFLFVNYLEPHLEYRPSKEFAEQFLPSDISYGEAMDVPQDAWEYISGTIEMTDRDFEILQSLYRAEIAYLDQRISELKEQLEEHDQWENTIFIVTGDHGENIGDHGLMDHQYCLYDTLLHVPLVIHGDAFTDGETADNLVQLTDLAPTLLDAAGIDAPDFRDQIQGRSFYPNTGTTPREYAVAEYMAPQPSMEALEKRVGQLPDSVYDYDRSLRAIRTDQWKLIRGSDGSRELYDIENDPDETTDISDENQATVQELESKLNDWLDSFEQADQSGSIEMREETKARLEDLGYLQ